MRLILVRGIRGHAYAKTNRRFGREQTRKNGFRQNPDCPAQPHGPRSHRREEQRGSTAPFSPLKISSQESDCSAHPRSLQGDWYFRAVKILPIHLRYRSYGGGGGRDGGKGGGHDDGDGGDLAVVVTQR